MTWFEPPSPGPFISSNGTVPKGWERCELAAKNQRRKEAQRTVPIRRDGGQGRNRTIDTRIFSPLLYQLSYLATLCAGGDPTSTKLGQNGRRGARIKSASVGVVKKKAARQGTQAHQY